MWWLEVAMPRGFESSGCCLSQSVGSQDQRSRHLHISNWNEEDDFFHQETNSTYGMHEGLIVCFGIYGQKKSHPMGETNSSAWCFSALLGIIYDGDMIHVSLLIPTGRFEPLNQKHLNWSQHQDIYNIITKNIYSLFLFGYNPQWAMHGCWIVPGRQISWAHLGTWPICKGLDWCAKSVWNCVLCGN